MKFQAPFTFIDLAYTKTITALLDLTLNNLQGLLTTPVLTCVTLWLVVQGILVMRGEVDARQGFGKMIMVSFVVSLVTTAPLYKQYVQDMFVTAIPGWIQQINNVPITSLPAVGGFTLPVAPFPTMLDAVFLLGEKLFLTVSARLTSDDPQDVFAFEGAQFLFYLLLWTLFGIYDTIVVMTDLMVTIGPLMLIGFLFQATRDMTTRWIGQLLSYSLLLLLVSIVATIVVMIEFTGVAAATLIIKTAPNAASVIGLYEMDMFIMTGNAIVVALPGIAAMLGGGLAVEAPKFVNSMFKRFHGGADLKKGDEAAKERAVMNRFFMSGNMQ